jgi:hypothetical protein
MLFILKFLTAIILITFVSFGEFCSKSAIPDSKQDNSNTRDKCENIEGEWNIYEVLDKQADILKCELTDCGVRISKIKFYCKSGEIVGEQLLGVDSKNNIENWKPLSIAYKDEKLLFTTKINENNCIINFEVAKMLPNRLVGRYYAKSCLINKKEINLDSNIVMLK